MQYLLAVFTKIFEWVLMIFGKRLALTVTVGATFVAGWVGLQAAVYALWVGVGYVMPADISDLMPYIVRLLPSNLVPCFSAYVSARLLVWLWAVQSDWLRFIMAAKS